MKNGWRTQIDAYPELRNKMDLEFRGSVAIGISEWSISSHYKIDLVLRSYIAA
jgi:hypothetical protein